MKLFLLLLLFAGCSTVVPKMDVNTVYKKDVNFTVNGKKFKGVGVVPRAVNYEISIEYPQGKIDLLSISNCHRDIQASSEGTKANLTFIPNDIEKDCPLDIGVYDEKGRHGWGYLFFEREDAILPAKLLCNGETIIARGVSACQSKIGTVQKIIFGYPVRGVSSEGCQFKQNGQEFEYEVVKNFCYYAFSDDHGNIHNHSIFGYETFPIRN